MVGCRDVVLTSRGEGLFGRLSKSGAKMSLQRGAMERSIASGLEIFRFRRRQSSEYFVESSVLRYLRACVSFLGKGNLMEGFAHWSSLSSRKWGWPLGARPRIWVQSWTPWSHGGVNFLKMNAASGKSCIFWGQPSLSNWMGMSVEMDEEIRFPDHISGPPVG